MQRRAEAQLALLDLPELVLSTLIEDSPQVHGEIFTRRWIVDLTLDLVGYTADQDLATVRALEPACGHGAFLLPMVERLVASCEAHGRSITEADVAIRAYDLLEPNVAAAREAVASLLRKHGVKAVAAKKLADRWITQADFLLKEHELSVYDVCVGNPPYIRLEQIPVARSNAYRKACPTMGGRADIFVGFYEVGLRALSPEGKLGFICADRWMRNAYGRDLRALVSEQYAVDAVITLHDVDAFEEHVSAYPAITVLRAGKQGPVVVADTTRAFGKESAGALSSWVNTGKDEVLQVEGLRAAWLGHWFNTAQGWPTGSPDRLALVADLEERFPTLEETGAKVGIGLASGADGIYVITDQGAAEAARMLPMVMGRDLRSGKVEWSGHYLVNPWDDNGLVDLTKWPKLNNYFSKHFDALAGRNIARKNPGREHRTIDRVITGLAEKPKLLLRDMQARIWPVLDEGKYYPHHNLYWVTSDEWDLTVLGGLLLSDVAELFISTYCVRMRGGTLRFQAQYLRRICLPRFCDISDTDRETLANAFERRDTGAATRVALRLYGLRAIPV